MCKAMKGIKCVLDYSAVLDRRGWKPLDADGHWSSLLSPIEMSSSLLCLFEDAERGQNGTEADSWMLLVSLKMS